MRHLGLDKDFLLLFPILATLAAGCVLHLQTDAH